MGCEPLLGWNRGLECREAQHDARQQQQQQCASAGRVVGALTVAGLALGTAGSGHGIAAATLPLFELTQQPGVVVLHWKSALPASGCTDTVNDAISHTHSTFPACKQLVVTSQSLPAH